MRKSRNAVCAVLGVLLLAGCSQMFDFNAYKGMDKPQAPTADKYAGSGGLDLLAQDLASPAMVAALRADPATLSAIEAMLQGQYQGGLGTPEGQQAAILYADLNLVTTSGDTLVNNVVTTVLGGIDANTSVNDLLEGILPADVKNDPVAFTAMINGLLDASNAYHALGTAIDGNGDGQPDSALPAGSNAGDIAQKALVAALVADVTTSLGLTPANAGQQLYNLLYDPNNYNGTGGTNPPAPSLSQDPALEALMNCAGLTLPS